jgi:hypothetical protein
MGPLTAEIMRKALRRLDEVVPHPFTLIVGGGGAMILAHGFPLGTTDIDAVPQGMELPVLDLLVKQIADEQNLPKDWLNPYFSTYSYTLPSDYGSRLIEIFSGVKLKALALGKNEMLIMKCFAHRQKDVGHAKMLIRDGADINAVEAHLEELLRKKIPNAQAAIDFLQDVQEQCERGAAP